MQLIGAVPSGRVSVTNAEGLRDCGAGGKGSTSLQSPLQISHSDRLKELHFCLVSGRSFPVNCLKAVLFIWGVRGMKT